MVLIMKKQKVAKVTAVVNQKGGVGKTTTAVSLGYGLVERGEKVLLIDFDPQSSLTVCMGYDDTDSIEYNISGLMSEVMQDHEVKEKDKFVLNHNGVDFIPCNIELSAIEVGLVNTMSREQQLKQIIRLYQNDYDYIIIDCSPSLGMLTINALTAADDVIIPVACEYLSAKGLELLLKNILRVRKSLNPDLDIAGILLTMYKGRTNLSKDIAALINDVYGKSINIYHTMIPVSVKISEASMNGTSIFSHDKRNKVSLAYKELVSEVIYND